MSKTASLWIRASLIALTMLAAWPPARAVDGVIEINDARAQAGGITPGDAPGYPVSIDQPGSYRLTGQLFVSGTNLDVVEITVDHVTLDLNGFSIRCLYAFETCVDQGGTGVGIRSTFGANVEIRNGTVRDMPHAGIWAGTRTRLQGVRVLNNGIGVYMLTGLIEDCSIYDNFGDGIIFGLGGSTDHGIIRDNLITGNDGDGIELYPEFDGALILSNVIVANGEYGIRNGDLSGHYFAYGHNSIRSNTSGHVYAPATATQTAGNYCGTSACP